MLSNHLQPSVIAFDVFGTLVKIEKRRSPYKKLLRWLQEQGRIPEPNDASVIMSQMADFEKLAMQFVGYSRPIAPRACK